MNYIILFCALFAAAIANGQDTTVQSLKTDASRTIIKSPKDTIPKIWKKGVLFSFNLSQGSLSNWAAGGDNFSLALAAHIKAHFYYKKGKNSWDNSANFNLGYVKTTSLGGRKNDDRIDVFSKYGYFLNSKLNVTALFNFRSQFFKGYTYTNNANGQSTAALSSDFMAPAYIVLGVGLDYHPVEELSVFVSPLTSRLTIVNNDSLSARGVYGVPAGKKSINAIGAYATIKYDKDLNKIVSYSGELDLFSNYKKHPQNVDVYLTNLFAVELSKVLSATWNFDLIYDDDVRIFGPNKNSPGLQLKSLIGIGLLVKL